MHHIIILVAKTHDKTVATIDCFDIDKWIVAFFNSETAVYSHSHWHLVHISKVCTNPE